MEGKTVIAIAHRLSTLTEMDRLIVLDKGAICEEGTHGELEAAGGIYADLWARQSGGFISADALEAEAEEREPVGMRRRRRDEDDEEDEAEAAE
jgi:ATP-binding cassette, subfamily B, multidrug efflux pump